MGARVCAGLLVAVGSVVFLGGWLLDVDALKSVIPGTVSMKASTANSLTFTGIALLLLIRSEAGRVRRRLGYVTALFPLAFGLGILAEYIFDWPLGMDEILFTDNVARAEGAPHPGRPAETTAACLVLTSLALLALNMRPRHGWLASEVLAALVAAVAGISLIGYTHSIPEFYGPASAANIAVHTALGLVIAASGIILCRPRGKLMSLVTTDAPGGMMARRLIPFVVLFPLALGWLELELGDASLFDYRVGTFLLTAATIVGMLLLLWRAAAQLNKVDTVRKNLEERLYTLANHDQMTGLFNRHRFQEELTRQAHHSRRHGATTAIAVIDLDRLKQVNDTLGHAAGDALIMNVADAIISRVRVTDVVGRLGGDEFAVITNDATAEGTALMAEGLVSAIRSAMPGVGAGDAWSTVSIGTAFSAGPLADDGSVLLAKADEAMYAAKRAGGDRTAASDPVLPPVRPPNVSEAATS